MIFAERDWVKVGKPEKIDEGDIVCWKGEGMSTMVVIVHEEFVYRKQSKLDDEGNTINTWWVLRR